MIVLLSVFDRDAAEILSLEKNILKKEEKFGQLVAENK